MPFFTLSLLCESVFALSSFEISTSEEEMIEQSVCFISFSFSSLNPGKASWRWLLFWC